MKINTFILAGSMILASVANLIGAEVSNRKMAWAHYTPWHSPFNSSLSALNYYNFPLQDSTGKQIEDWKREIQIAKAHGIDGFFVDVIADRNGGSTVYVNMMESMLKAAEGTDFQIGACLDAKTNVAQQVRELKKILDRSGNHPNYPKWNGKPVVDTYTFTRWKPEEITSIREKVKEAGHDIFLIGNVAVRFQDFKEDRILPYVKLADMIYPFEMLETNRLPVLENNKQYAKFAEKAGKELMITIYPGYYGGWLSGSNDFYQVHCGFDHAHRCFEATNDVKAKWLHYTTWNDLVETSLMPMIFTPANPLIIKAYSEKFKGLNTVTGKPEVVFAYHREELAGTLLRFEAMTLPTLESGKVEVKGRLLDETGKEVAQLPVKSLEGNAFDRTEWLIPTTALAKHPVLIPEFDVNGKTVRLPEVLLVTGWHQNGVTVKTAASRIIMPESSMNLKAESDGRIRVSGNYKSPVQLKRVSLWRNDRPIAVISPESNRKSLISFRITGAANVTVEPIGGKIISAVRNFEENHTPAFEWNAASLKIKKANRWTNVAVTAAGLPSMKFRFVVDGMGSFAISAEELMKRESVQYGQSTIRVENTDGTIQNRSALKRSEGTFNFGLFCKARPQDRWQLCFEGTDGSIGWSFPVWPFAVKKTPMQAKVFESSITLETASYVTGWEGRSEYLSKEVPCQTPKVQNTELSPLSIRGGRWDFEENGNDRYGDMSVRIPESMFCEGKNGEGKALRFTGKESVKMRLRTYPVGSSTVEFLIRPDAGRSKTQGIITRLGWSTALNIYLLANGKIEVMRDGHKKIKAETAVSSVPIPDNVWSRVRITCDEESICIYINGELAAEQAISPQRCYGNCTWYLGRGDKRSANFTGSLDALTVFGTAFAPDDENEPKFGKADYFRPLLSADMAKADESSAITGKWAWPANIERRPDAGDNAAPSTAKLKGPVLAGSDTLLLGPGPNTVKIRAEGVTLTDKTILTVKVRRFDRGEPKKAWFALLIAIGNDDNKQINFNFGSSKSLMITEMKPKWKIVTGGIKVNLPVDLQIAKRDGMLIFKVNGKVVYTADDDPNHPFSELSFQTSSPNRADAVAIRIDPPVLCKLK